MRVLHRAWVGQPWEAGSRCLGLVIADPNRPAWINSASPAIVPDDGPVAHLNLHLNEPGLIALALPDSDMT